MKSVEGKLRPFDGRRFKRGSHRTSVLILPK